MTILLKKSEAEEEEVLPPTGAASSPSKEEMVDLNSKWLKENMPRLLTQAMDNPTAENLSRYYTAQRLMLDISTRFFLTNQKIIFLKTR